MNRIDYVVQYSVIFLHSIYRRYSVVSVVSRSFYHIIPRSPSLLTVRPAVEFYRRHASEHRRPGFLGTVHQRPDRFLQMARRFVSIAYSEHIKNRTNLAKNQFFTPTFFLPLLYRSKYKNSTIILITLLYLE